ncbi:MAG: ribosome recycling factor [Candidatus Margulisiibacteriota bacterium]|nr:ribosome recycling factor [Candidatus Margulisiibacteriota bacterium]
MSDIIKDTELKMQKAIDALKKKLAGVRTGRASSGLVSSLQVEYYGAKVPLQQLANIAVPEPRTIAITPFDKGAAKDIEKAIQMSDLGISPNSEGGVIRINLPQLTEERRKELGKHVKKESEEAKVAIRNIRREAMDILKKQKEAKELSEDAEKMKEQELQKLTDKEVDGIDKVLQAKEKEIMEV